MACSCSCSCSCSWLISLALRLSSSMPDAFEACSSELLSESMPWSISISALALANSSRGTCRTASGERLPHSSKLGSPSPSACSWTCLCSNRARLAFLASAKAPWSEPSPMSFFSCLGTSRRWRLRRAGADLASVRVSGSLVSRVLCVASLIGGGVWCGSLRLTGCISSPWPAPLSSPPLWATRVSLASTSSCDLDLDRATGAAERRPLRVSSCCVDRVWPSRSVRSTCEVATTSP